MEEVLALYAGHAFLGGRAGAHRVRTKAEDVLRTNRCVVLDFNSVQGVSHSFADELLSPLADLLQAKLSDKVSLINCSQEVLEELKSVAEMHRLPMPHICTGTRERRSA
jgi:hypothetical protein